MSESGDVPSADHVDDEVRDFIGDFSVIDVGLCLVELGVALALLIKSDG